MYRPAIKNAKIREHFKLSGYTLVFMDCIQPAGLIEYKFVLEVLDTCTAKPCLFVASERNQFAELLKSGGSHFLCVYDGARHENHGSSDDWSFADKFRARAIELVMARLGILKAD